MQNCALVVESKYAKESHLVSNDITEMYQRQMSYLEIMLGGWVGKELAGRARGEEGAIIFFLKLWYLSQNTR